MILTLSTLKFTLFLSRTSISINDVNDNMSYKLYSSWFILSVVYF